MKMFSAMLRLVNRFNSWWMKAIPARVASEGVRGLVGLRLEQHRRRCPARTTPPSMFIRVLLPAPFCADQAKHVPALELRLTSRSGINAEERLADVLEFQKHV